MGDQLAVAIVPAYEEGERVAGTVEGLLRIASVRHVLVVDDGSSDETSAAAIRAGATCISLGRNRGKGGALNAGIATVRGYVLSGRWPVPDAILLADADLGTTAALLEKLIAPVLAGRADLAIADLPPQPGAGGFGLVKRLARWGLRDMELREPLSGQRAISWAALPSLTPFAGGFGVDVQMTLDALASRLGIVEVTLPLTHAVTGKGLAGALHRGTQAAAVARAIVHSRVSFRAPTLRVRRWISRTAKATEAGRRLPR
jgi:glycosyltransferase involved in cell wall biosynthesis